MKKTTVCLFVFLLSISTYPCTTAIFSGKITESGRPIIWKHRDSGFENNKIVQIEGTKYAYTGLINSHDAKADEIWAGYNELGFAIMNSASYNLRCDQDIQVKDREGILMRIALEQCANLKDFENLLDTITKPSGIEANFGVVDASGAVAYYETNDSSYVKVSGDNNLIAPKGYIIRTNYSFTGRADEGYGFIRYNTAKRIIDQQLEAGKISPEFIFKQISKSVENSLTGDNIKSIRCSELDNRFMNISDCITRYSSVSSILIHGVNNQKDAVKCSMWTMLGNPLLALPTVTYLNMDVDLPEVVTAADSSNAPLCDLVLKAKSVVFPRKVESHNYINVSKYSNYEKSGYKERVKALENTMFFHANLIDTDMYHNYDNERLKKYYNRVTSLVNNKFKIIIKNTK
jgi:hypothetical protein